MKPLYWFVAIVFAAAILYWLSRDYRRRRSMYRRSAIDELKENELNDLTVHLDRNPFVMLAHIEKLIARYDITEEELGVSITDLIGHALSCQGKVVVRLEAEVSSLREEYSVYTKRIEHMPQRQWMSEIKSSYFHKLFESNEKLRKQGGNLQKLQLRWFEAKGVDPDLAETHPPLPQSLPIGGLAGD